jgi:TorA maturation chaperone TorD
MCGVLFSEQVTCLLAPQRMKTEPLRVRERPLPNGRGSFSEQGDHIDHELGYLAFLCAAESEALEDGKQPIATQIRHLQANFLTNHLLQWLPPLVLAVQRQNHPFYGALAALTLALADDHLAALASW